MPTLSYSRAGSVEFGGDSRRNQRSNSIQRSMFSPPSSSSSSSSRRPLNSESVSSFRTTTPSSSYINLKRTGSASYLNGSSSTTKMSGKYGSGNNSSNSMSKSLYDGSSQRLHTSSYHSNYSSGRFLNSSSSDRLYTPSQGTNLMYSSYASGSRLNTSMSTSTSSVNRTSGLTQRTNSYKSDLSRSLYEGSSSSSGVGSSKYEFTSRPSTSSYSSSSSTYLPSSSSKYKPSPSYSSSSTTKFEEKDSIERSYARIRNKYGSQQTSTETKLNGIESSLEKNGTEKSRWTPDRNGPSLKTSTDLKINGWRSITMSNGSGWTSKSNPGTVNKYNVNNNSMTIRMSNGSGLTTKLNSEKEANSTEDIINLSSKLNQTNVNEEFNIRKDIQRSSSNSSTTSTSSSLSNQSIKIDLNNNAGDDLKKPKNLLNRLQKDCTTPTPEHQKLPSPPRQPIKIEPRKVMEPTQLQKMIKMCDFDQEKFKTTLMQKKVEEEEKKKIEGAKSLANTDRQTHHNSTINNNKTVDSTRQTEDVEFLVNKVDKSTSKNKTVATLILPTKLNSQSTDCIQVPSLIITHPSVPSTPTMSSSTSGVTWTVKNVDAEGNEEDEEKSSDEIVADETSYDDEDECSDEDAESEWEESEEDDVEYDAQLTIPLFTTSVNSTDSLHPNHALARRQHRSSITSSTDFDTDFDLTLMVKPMDHSKDQRGRTSQTNILPPPPIFTASVTYDGMDSWDSSNQNDSEEFEDEEDENGGKVFYAKANHLDVGEGGVVYLSPQSYSASESEYEGNVEVGCTLSLVERIALQDSMSEYTTTTDSEEYEDESEGEYYDEEEEEECSDEGVIIENTAVVEEKTNIEVGVTKSSITSVVPITQETQTNVNIIEKQPEDKSAFRKAPENMRLEDQQKIEQQQKELAKQKARQTGQVTAIRDLYRQHSPPKQEPITYKRSSRLEPKLSEEQRPKRTYEVVKPVINDEFDKQMAQLREQMKDKTRRLQSEYKDLSKGIHSTTDDAKLRAMEEQHRELLGKTSDTFSKADEERKRWQEQHVSETERKYKESEERKRQMELQKAADEKAAALALAESRKVTRRVRKIGDSKPDAQSMTPQVPQQVETKRLDEKSATPEKKVLAPTENTLLDVPTTQPQVSGERRKSIPSSRRKTMELIKLTPDNEDENANVNGKKARKRKHQPHRRNKFTRKPFDIDDLLGFGAFKSFDQLDDYFQREASSKLPPPMIRVVDKKRRRMEPQKVWISQLKDIDKLYKSSELRDIKLDGVS